MPKLLIAVKSCQSHWGAGYHDAILNTWGRSLPPDVDLRFFVGGSTVEMSDGHNGHVTILPVKDDYDSLPFKTKAIAEWSSKNDYDFEWSSRHDYDFTFLCDTDTFLNVC